MPEINRDLSRRVAELERDILAALDERDAAIGLAESMRQNRDVRSHPKVTAPRWHLTVENVVSKAAAGPFSEPSTGDQMTAQFKTAFLALFGVADYVVLQIQSNTVMGNDEAESLGLHELDELLTELRPLALGWTLPDEAYRLAEARLRVPFGIAAEPL